MSDLRSRIGKAPLLAAVLLTGFGYAAEAKVSCYRHQLSPDERHCLHQLLQTAWPFSANVHQKMISAAVVVRAHLNQRRPIEYIYVISESNSCGTAGCSMLIGEEEGGMCHVIYDYWGSPDAITILRKRDHGYRRLYTPCEVRFDGREYRQVHEECPNANVQR